MMTTKIDYDITGGIPIQWKHIRVGQWFRDGSNTLVKTGDTRAFCVNGNFEDGYGPEVYLHDLIDDVEIILRHKVVPCEAARNK